jgi:hypothetical protein
MVPTAAKVGPSCITGDDGYLVVYSIEQAIWVSTCRRQVIRGCTFRTRTGFED